MTYQYPCQICPPGQCIHSRPTLPVSPQPSAMQPPLTGADFPLFNGMPDPACADCNGVKNGSIFFCLAHNYAEIFDTPDDSALNFVTACPTCGLAVGCQCAILLLPYGQSPSGPARQTRAPLPAPYATSSTHRKDPSRPSMTPPFQQLPSSSSSMSLPPRHTIPLFPCTCTLCIQTTHKKIPALISALQGIPSSRLNIDAPLAHFIGCICRMCLWPTLTQIQQGLVPLVARPGTAEDVNRLLSMQSVNFDLLEKPEQGHGWLCVCTPTCIARARVFTLNRVTAILDKFPELLSEPSLSPFLARTALQSSSRSPHLPVTQTPAQLKTSSSCSNRQPYSRLTEEQMPWDTPIGGDVVNCKTLQSQWPHNKITGEKLPLGTPIGGNVVNYKTLHSQWPHNKITGEKLPLGTPIDDNVVPYHILHAMQAGYTASKTKNQQLIQVESQKRNSRRNKNVVYAKEAIGSTAPPPHRAGSPAPSGTTLRRGQFSSKNSFETTLKRIKTPPRVYLGEGPLRGFNVRPEHYELQAGATVVIEGFNYTVVSLREEYFTRYPQ